MSITSRILLGLLVIVIAIQFIKSERNIHPQAQQGSIVNHMAVSHNVETILKKACYDCHSNNTKYPWYANIQPVAWYLTHHVNEGKHELNFDEFASYDAKKQDHKLEEVIETVEEGEMPVASYTLMHKEAKLSKQEKAQLIDWAKKVRASLSTEVSKTKGE
jgi:cytochrome c551/c552